jgi:rhodanese-related sulfurtransferase
LAPKLQQDSSSAGIEREKLVTQAQGFRRIGPAAAREIMSRGEALILDVRDAGAYERGHIEGAEHATQETLGWYLSDTPKDMPVIICCYHGVSSLAYAKIFADWGFSDVSSLDGGYEAWAAQERAAPALAPSAALQAFLVGNGFAPGDVNSRNKDGATPLMVAVRLAPLALVQELLQAGADIHAVTVDGNQALWLACVGEIVENIKLLIDAGAEIQHVNANGATPLMFAASSGRAKAVAALLAAGADPLFETDLGLTALDMASTRECLDLMRAAARRAKVM